MAVYSAILIGSGYVGGSDNVTVTENNGAGSLNQLLATVGNEKYIIDSFEVWSDNIDQLQQPLGLIQLSADGNHKNKIIVPQKDVYSFGNILKELKTGDFPLDENTRLTYNVLPNTNTKLTLNINKNIRKDNSLTKDLINAGAKSIQPEILKSLGLPEPEELEEPKKTVPKLPNLKITSTAKAASQNKETQPLLNENEHGKKLIFAGLVIVAGAFALYALSGGAANLFINTKTN